MHADETDGKGAWVGLMRAADRNPLGVLVVVLLVVEVGLVTTAALVDGSSERLVLIIGMVLVLLLVVLAVARLRPAHGTPEIQTIWSDADLPLARAVAQSWCKRWNCRWMYRAEDGRLFPYVDDIVIFEDVDRKSGFVIGKGLAAYEDGVDYKVSGRISNRGLGVFFYSSAGTKFVGLDGTFILRRNPIGEMEGWWMGNARTVGEVQGRVTFSEPVAGEQFQKTVYPHPSPDEGKPG